MRASRLHVSIRARQPQRLCQPQWHSRTTRAACGSQRDPSNGRAGAGSVELRRCRLSPGRAGSPLRPPRQTAVAARRPQRDLDDWTADADGPRLQARRPAGRGAPEEGSGWQQRLWGAVDVGATLGAVGGAVAFVLTQEALLVGLPVVLPLLALYASRRHAQLRLEVRAPARAGCSCAAAVGGLLEAAGPRPVPYEELLALLGGGPGGGRVPALASLSPLGSQRRVCSWVKKQSCAALCVWARGCFEAR